MQFICVFNNNLLTCCMLSVYIPFKCFLQHVYTMQLSTQKDQGEFCIDTVSLSIDLSVVGHFVDSHYFFNSLVTDLSDSSSLGDSFPIFRALNALVKYLFPSGSLELETVMKTGLNFFDHRVNFHDSCGFIAFGGNNTHIDKHGNQVKSVERMQIQITGEGCRRVGSFSFTHDRIFSLAEYSPSITRIDIAYDDHRGLRNIDLAKNMHERGMFSANGRPPKARFIDDMGTGDGCSLYVGRKQSGKELNVYEKGKEQGDKFSKWVRWEGRLYAQDRVIPLDVLVLFEEYLIGMYPALHWMGKAKRVIKTSKIKESIQFNVLKKHAKNSYGALIHFMKIKGFSDEDIVRQLIRSGEVPKRLSWTTHTPDIQEDYETHDKKYPHLYPEEAKAI